MKKQNFEQTEKSTVAIFQLLATEIPRLAKSKFATGGMVMVRAAVAGRK